MVIFVTTGFFVRTDGLAFQLQFLVEWLITEGGANTDCTDKGSIAFLFPSKRYRSTTKECIGLSGWLSVG